MKICSPFCSSSYNGSHQPQLPALPHHKANPSTLVTSQKPPEGLFYSMPHLSTPWYLKYLPFSHHLTHIQRSKWAPRDLVEFHHQLVQFLPLPQCICFLRPYPTCPHVVFAISPTLSNLHHVHVSL